VHGSSTFQKCLTPLTLSERRFINSERAILIAGGLDAAGDKRDADYKIATEKCDSLAGDAKSACISAAKSKYGKS